MIGCGGATASTGVGSSFPKRPPPAKDWALDLVARLPADADRCEVARPALLNDDQRALYAPVAHAVVAWRDALGVTAFARAERERADGASAPPAVAWLRVEAPEARVREVLAGASGLALVWDQDAAECGPHACPTAVRFVEPGLVRMTRGMWPAPPVGKGVAPRCRALAERHADAVEIWARRASDLPREGEMGVPLRSASVVSLRTEGVRLVRDDLMSSGAVAEAAAQAQRAGAVPAMAFGVPGLTGDVRQADVGVVVTLDVLWEDLRFARDDRARQADAERYASVLERLEPDDRIDPSALATVAAQVEARIELLELARVPDAGLLDATRTLLTRALAAHPSDATLAGLRDRLDRHEALRAPRP